MTISTEKAERAAVCAELFELHNLVNIAVSRSVCEIMDGADAQFTVNLCTAEIQNAAEELRERIAHD